MIRGFFFILFMLGSFQLAAAETIYIDVQKGDDNNPGSYEKPLTSIQKAIDIANSLNESGPTTIKIAPGLYPLKSACLISNKREYTEKDRLIIEADILPDDKNWRIQDMPIIVSVENPTTSADSKYKDISGLKVEISHVTIRGLKFTGTPVPKVMYYPIFRQGKDLNDLVISQCMFLGSQHVSTCNVAVLANGNGLKVDHCIFYGCANAVVYWDAEGGVSKNNALTYSIIYGGYVSGVWLCQADEDFTFHHNIISDCQYSFMRSDTNINTYHIKDSIINNYKYFSGKSTPEFKLGESGPDMPYREKNIVKTGNIQLEKGPGLDQDVPHRYLHILLNTWGSDIGAGLFMN